MPQNVKKTTKIQKNSPQDPYTMSHNRLSNMIKGKEGVKFRVEQRLEFKPGL